MPVLIIDTNVLLLHVVGSHDPAMIPRLKRTAEFDFHDFRLLQETLRKYSGLVITASILAEVSDLLPNWAHQVVAETMSAAFGRFSERGVDFRHAFADPAFDRLGFTDTVIKLIASNEEAIEVLTDDVHLFHELAYRGVNVTNFNHLRSPRTIG